MSSSPVDEPIRARREATRVALIEASAQIMVDDGYAAATSRRVAAKAGVKPALMHYYFPSMDDLFVAVLRGKQRRFWNIRARQWQIRNRCTRCGRKAIRSEIVSYAMRFRDIEEGAMNLALKARGIFEMQSWDPQPSHGGNRRELGEDVHG